MAHVYVDSNAAGGADGTSWADAYTTLKAAAEAAGTAAGDNIWVAHDHAETQASAMTIAPKNTEAAPGTIVAVNKAGSVPPVSADLVATPTATVTTTGANAMTLNGASTYWYGITFNCGSGAVNSGLLIGNGTGNFHDIFENCALKKLGTNNNQAGIRLGPSRDGRVTLKNTTVEFGNTADGMAFLGWTTWFDTAPAIVGATIPTVLVRALATASGTTRMSGLDLTALAGGTIIGAGAIQTALIRNCKLDATAVVAETPTGHGHDVVLINSDSGDTNYRTEKYSYAGTLTTETTIVRSGGASDGTTPIAWKLVTTANSELQAAFESLPITIWNDTLSEITLDIEGIWGDGAVPDNNEIWMEVDYLGDGDFPISSRVSTGLADFLATPAALSAGSGTWGGSTTKFKMSATFTPAEKGPIMVRIFAAAASSTFYIDPKIVVS
ncbi:MAG: hypothetical protein Q8P46_15095 [Hyphomicrobiales bacterium]|nr:hypothetical protein [Hyphomicrobiales bacterium]